MKKKSKYFLSLSLAFLILFGDLSPSLAITYLTPIEKIAREFEIQHKQEAIWYYRYVSGRKQKRLWSKTKGKWLTDWEWIDYAGAISIN